MKGMDSPLVVALRIRPMSDEEMLQGATPITHRVDGNMVVLFDPSEDPDDILRANRSREKQYMFDVTFDGRCQQEEIYEHTTKSLIQNVIHGYNATVFAYGATGAGKTYTMLGTQREPGIMPRTLNDLFRAMEETMEDMQYKVTMSYLEIYNEMIRDLLNPSSGYLELREDSKGEIQVTGLTEVSTRSTSEIMSLLHQGNAVRTQEPTKANKTSSRSHAVLQVTVKQRNRARNINDSVRMGKLFLIDLAGSERASNTQNRGKRMVEGAHINRSLLALGNCINALSEKGAKYVNYRDSKLTRLLKDSLGGNCKTVMIAHISPTSFNFDESRNTLLYADRAKQIKTKVRKNLVDVQYHVAQYTAIIQELREEIERLRTKLTEKGSEDKQGLSIQRVQNEVLQREHEVILVGIKEQLLTAFKDQMELRESMMELNTAILEIEHEKSRHQVIISEWEAEKIRNLKRKTSMESEGSNMDKDLEKLRELHELGETPASDDVRIARTEMKNLAKELQRTDTMKNNVEKGIIQSRHKILAMVEELPRKVGNKDHLEVLLLLCQLHEKEIANAEMKTELLIRQHELEHKDMVMQTYHHHRNLADEIIHRQRVLIDEYNIKCPKDLEELYELYLQERDEHNLTRTISLPSLQQLKVSSIASIGRKYVDSDESEKLHPEEKYGPSGDTTSIRRIMLKKSSENIAQFDQETQEKLFAQSPKSRHILEAQSVMMNRLTATPSKAKHVKENSIYTLSVRSNSSVESNIDTHGSDKNGKLIPNAKSYLKSPNTQRKEIANNTRGIAALAAAKKRNKVSGSEYGDRLGVFDPNKTYVSLLSNMDHLEMVDDYLSPSRLATHDKKYGSTANVHLLADDAISMRSYDKRSILTDNSPAKRAIGRKKLKGATPAKKLYRNSYDQKKKAKSQESSSHPSYQQLGRTGPRRIETKQTVPLSKSVQKKRQLQLNRQMQAGSRAPGISDIKEFETTPTPPSTVYQTNGADRTRGLSLQKRLRGAPSDSSAASTPLTNPGQKNLRRPAPTIPSYRKGDISITGFGLR